MPENHVCCMGFDYDNEDEVSWWGREEMRAMVQLRRSPFSFALAYSGLVWNKELLAKGIALLNYKKELVLTFTG